MNALPVIICLFASISILPAVAESAKPPIVVSLTSSGVTRAEPVIHIDHAYIFFNDQRICFRIALRKSHAEYGNVFCGIYHSHDSNLSIQWLDDDYRAIGTPQLGSLTCDRDGKIAYSIRSFPSDKTLNGKVVYGKQLKNTKGLELFSELALKTRQLIDKRKQSDEQFLKQLLDLDAEVKAIPSQLDKARAKALGQVVIE